MKFIVRFLNARLKKSQSLDIFVRHPDEWKGWGPFSSIRARLTEPISSKNVHVDKLDNLGANHRNRAEDPADTSGVGTGHQRRSHWTLSPLPIAPYIPAME